MEGRHITHMCISVRGVLGRGLKYCGSIGMRHDDGRKATPHEVQDWLMDELAKGHEVVPLGECDNFDFKKGCQGHPLEEKP